MLIYQICIFLVGVVVFTDAVESPVVKLNCGGEVRGSMMKSQKGRKIYAFRGIPYAEPPTSERRFKPPVPKSYLQDAVHDATKDGPACVHVDMISKSPVGQEDCLYLNVYSPQLPRSDNEIEDDDNDESDKSDEKRAVMVFIHGGGFSLGHAKSIIYGPGRLLDVNVVLVSMNYRLGPIGFLSTNDDASRGNYGLMDQSLALKWVHDNIEAFGGDASRVTIFGESAGAASVGYHLLSPMSSGLFHAAIAQSGSPLCSWAFQEEPVYWAKKLAKEFKCTTDSSEEMVECLRGVSAKDIMKKSNAFMTIALLPLVFTPTLDGTFLTTDPREAMASGKVTNNVPFITGINKDEGIFFYSGILRDHSSTDLFSKKGISEVTKYMLDDKGSSDEPSNLITEKYLSGVDMNDKEATQKTAIRIFSDSMFDICHYETAKLLSQHGFQTYIYSLDYSPSTNLGKLFGVKENLGVSHSDDLFFFFDGMIFGLLKPNEDDAKVMNALQTLWSNFAKYSDPTPNITELLTVDWEPSVSEKLSVFHINTEITTSTYDTSKEDLYQFWSEKVQTVLDKTIQRTPKDEL